MQCRLNPNEAKPISLLSLMVSSPLQPDTYINYNVIIGSTVAIRADDKPTPCACVRGIDDNVIYNLAGSG